MAVVDLKGVHIVTARGKAYHYAWRGKGAPRLKSKPGTDAYVQELAEALASRTGAKGRVSRLVADYIASDDWKNLAEKTRASWLPWLERIKRDFGAMTITAFDNPKAKPRIRAWHSRFRKNPRSADMGKQVLSRVMKCAVDQGLVQINPCAGIPNLYDGDRSAIIWTPDDIAELRKHASPEVMWAVELAALTGLRQGDLLRLVWTNIGPLAIEIRTSKTGQTAVIPLYPALRELLARIPRRSTTVLTNSTGKPWRGGLTSSFGKAKAAAGLSRLHFHDLRGTAATRFYLAGLKVRAIAGILAWSEDRVEGILTRYVKRDEVLLDLIRQLDPNANGTEPVKHHVKQSAAGES